MALQGGERLVSKDTHSGPVMRGVALMIFGVLLSSFWNYNVCSQPSFLPSYFLSSSPSWLCFSWYNFVSMDGSVQMADYFYSPYPHWSPYQIQSASHTLTVLFQTYSLIFCIMNRVRFSKSLISHSSCSTFSLSIHFFFSYLAIRARKKQHFA